MNNYSQAELVEHENKQWSKIFQEELDKKQFVKFSSYWWENYYNNISKYFSRYIKQNGYNSIFEPGSGSGKATILLDTKAKKVLLDISEKALDYAKFLAGKFSCENIEFIKYDIFKLDELNTKYDFVWNLGVVEHYSDDQILQIFIQMIKSTNSMGTVAIGVPNLYSGPTLKAYLLTFKIFKSVKGYRLDTEKYYPDEKIKNLFKLAVESTNRNILEQKFARFGNPLFMETPKFILKYSGPLFKLVLFKNQFLKFYIFKLD
jgi:2-polyprenyl-3-methyl-5-hydroxy-6-metoxy-1,4-benzoquinol methylase